MFTWAQSINSRIHGNKREGESLSGWREAINNAEKLLDLANQLALISKKSKLFGTILCHFLGDVQMYAEVNPIHTAVNGVFAAALDDIADTRDKIKDENGAKVTFASRQTYIVAHSEGTVVSWKSLMLAAEAPAQPAWLQEIEGLVTLGSPIDKHHLFWGEQNFPPDIKTPQAKKIPWWNFWDYSDPVAHSLHSIFPGPDPAENNQFKRIYDAGFARYPVPGVAHVDYWTDTYIYHRIIEEVMKIPAGYTRQQLKTNSRWWGQWLLMQTGNLVSYCLGRAAEAVAVVYFLTHLIDPARARLLAFLSADVPALESAFDLSNKWPLIPDFLTGTPWLDMTVRIMAASRRLEGCLGCPFLGPPG